MDFWTKSFKTSEIAEQASANLWGNTKYAFVKAIEWSRGKKHLVRFTGIHLMGRLAVTRKETIDEMFEPFFEELAVVGKDSRLSAVIALGIRSKMLNKMAVELARIYRLCEQKDTVKPGGIFFDELTTAFI